MTDPGDLTVVIPRPLAGSVRAAVDAGYYASASEVVGGSLASLGGTARAADAGPAGRLPGGKSERRAATARRGAHHPGGAAENGGSRAWLRFSSPLVESDLQGIWLGVAAKNRTAADRLLRRLTARIASLADFPGLGSPRPEPAPNARILAEGKYLVVYEPVERGVEVVRVLQGARNLPEPL